MLHWLSFFKFYLVLSPLGALAEFNQAGFSHRPQPTTLCAFEISCADILDLSTTEGRREAKISLKEMACDFRYLKSKLMAVNIVENLKYKKLALIVPLCR